MSTRADFLTYVLCACVRALTMRQAARLLGFSDEPNLRRFVRNLKAAGLVNVLTVWAKPAPEMTEPLLRFTREGVEEQFPHVLTLTRARWAGLPAVPATCILATRKAGRIHGVKRTGSLAKPLQCSHDLAVSECFIAQLEAGRIRAEDWQGEDFADFRLGDRTPDAVIVGGAMKKPQQIEEIVGADYTIHKLLDIHRECRNRRLPFELW